MDLTSKQRQFVAFYLGESNGNATDAARRAGYKHPNVSGPRLLVKVGIRAAIDAKLDSTALSSERILARLSEIADGGLVHVLKVESERVVTLDFRQAKRRGKLGLLKKLKHTEHGVEIETHDPLKALEMLGKYRGLWDGKAAEQTTEGTPTQKVRDKLDGLSRSPDRTGDPGE